MKKLVLSLFFLGFIGMVSCKKDNSVQPSKQPSAATSGGDPRDLGTGD